MVRSPCSPRDSQESSLTPHFESINSLVLSFLYGPTLTSIHYYWKNCGGGGLVAKSCPTLAIPWTVPTRLLCPWDSPGKILEWDAISFSRDLPDLGIKAGFPALQADDLTN